MPKYSLHFVQPCHFQVPSSFQASVVEHNFCPLFVFISVIFVPQHIQHSMHCKRSGPLTLPYASAHNDQSPAAPS